MKKYLMALMMCSTATTTWIFSAQAQAQAEAPGPAPIEAFYCNYKDGKTNKDLMKVGERFSKWADKNDPGYSAWVLTPHYGMGADLPQLIWLGSWANGNDLGKGTAGFLKNGGDLQSAFDEVVDCSIGHVLASSVTVNAPDGSPENGVVMFAECELDDDSSWMNAVAAHKKLSGAMRGMGAKGSSWMFFPMLGGLEREFDYFSVSTFNSWADFGAAYELYVTGGGYQKFEEILDGVADCNESTPTVWNFQEVHKAES